MGRSNNKAAYIYGLADPRTGDIRYVGKSEYLTRRWRGYLNDTTDSRRGRWLRKLAREGLRPLFYILEGPCEDWEEAERRWISKLRSEGADLTNLTDGGIGVVNPTWELRQKRANAKRNRKADTKAREKMSASQKKRWKEMSPAARAAIVAPMRAKMPILHSPATLAKVSAAHKKRWAEMSPEKRAETVYKMHVSKRGKPHTPEHNAAISAALLASELPRGRWGPHTLATKQKISATKLAAPKLICNRCGKEVGGGPGNLVQHLKGSKCLPLLAGDGGD